MAGKVNPGALAGAAGAGMPCHAEAAAIPRIARGEAQRHKRGTPYNVISSCGDWNGILTGKAVAE